MTSINALLLILTVAGCLSSFSTISVAVGEKINKFTPQFHPTVEIEEIVTSYTPANNGAGPMWCYGSTVIARQGDDVYLSLIETGKDVPLLCNTRWQLWQRTSSGWQLRQNEKDYRQREPCPVGVFQMVDGKADPFQAEACEECETCISVCTTGALTLQ